MSITQVKVTSKVNQSIFNIENLHGNGKLRLGFHPSCPSCQYDIGDILTIGTASEVTNLANCIPSTVTVSGAINEVIYNGVQTVCNVRNRRMFMYDTGDLTPIESATGTVTVDVDSNILSTINLSSYLGIVTVILSEDLPNMRHLTEEVAITLIQAGLVEEVV